jgi:hypothetical protein
MLRPTYIIPIFNCAVTNLQDKVATGISIPKNLKDRIDHDRKDISRSRYILRLLEKVYGREEINENKGNAPNKSRYQTQTHSAIVNRSPNSKSLGDSQVV